MTNNSTPLTAWNIEYTLNQDERPTGYSQGFETPEDILDHLGVPADLQADLVRGIRLAKKTNGDCIFHHYRVRGRVNGYSLMAK